MTDATATRSDEQPSPNVPSDEVRSRLRGMAAVLTVNLTGWTVAWLLFRSEVPAAVLQPWLLIFAVLWLVRLGGLLLTWRAGPAALGSARWQSWWVGAMLVSAALWGAGAWLFYPHLDSTHVELLLIIGYTLCIAAAPVLLHHPLAFLLFPVLYFGPVIVRIAITERADSHVQAGILLFVFALTFMLVRGFRHSLLRTFELQRQSDRLLEQLRIEKASADAARLAAEAANRAKSRFLAAASHDLRQPMHAMGLFAGALRQKKLDAATRRIVASINDSVDALEEQFSQLLDQSRIESGAIEVRAQCFAVSELYRKLRLRFEPLAFEKGLALRFRGGAQLVHTDPLLLDRIVNNLVSNALRYTRDGTVLVGCRRRGDRLLLQVWDTGEGIHEQDQTRVFNEPYQWPDMRLEDAPHRQRQGLGLSIVRGLSELIGAPVSLRSSRGRGSVFTVDLAVGHPADASQAEPLAHSALTTTLGAHTIVVIEDDAAVRHGLEALLLGWGAHVHSFDSLASFMRWAVSSHTTVTPDLVVVDYWLEEGVNGVDTLAAVREQFGSDIPAILVSATTLSPDDIHSRIERVHVLIKPVAPVKLRALITHTIGQPAH
jgi:signal transduction histidine kinase